MDIREEEKEEFLHLISIKTNDMPQGYINDSIQFDLSFHKCSETSMKSKRYSEPHSPFDIDLQPITPHDSTSENNLPRNSSDRKAHKLPAMLSHTNDLTTYKEKGKILNSPKEPLNSKTENFLETKKNFESKFGFKEIAKKPLTRSESFLSDGPSIHLDINVQNESLSLNHHEFKVNIINCDEEEFPFKKSQDPNHFNIMHNETLLKPNPLFKISPILTFEKFKLRNRKPKKSTLGKSNQILDPIQKNMPKNNTLEPPKVKITTRSHSSNKSILEVPKIKMSVRSNTSAKLSTISTQDNHSPVAPKSKKRLTMNPYLQKHSKKILMSLIGDKKGERVKSGVHKGKKKRIVF